ncbi:MAG: phenylalanine--tRNA ligase subunit beta [Gemmatimonadetes bacterium]|nr:phenylalanine--tRNA ligase subunit beta [Gemmatimonadota bacterium]
MVIKVPLSWLRAYCDIPWSVEELVERLIMTGLEVDAVETVGSDFEGFVTGHVARVERHPNADRLSLCSVDVGTETLQIICGAPNVAAGQKVPVAPIGTSLPGGMKIKKAKIRGVESFGMVCSEAELNLSDDHDGIMVLDEAIEPGLPLKDVLGEPETVLSIDVGTNRPDCLSLVGIAREITALSGGELRMPSTSVDESGPTAESLANVRVDAPEDCPRFVGRVIAGVRIGPSPDWLKRRVEAAGIRSISNVVDVTNYVMLEMGQPLHAYDLDRLAGQGIIVRRAVAQEPFTTLDGVERTLGHEVLMIADHERGIGVGGVMGGLNTEITADTGRVFLEGACFDAVRVRRGSKALQLQTDASRRFERGMDPELQGAAVSRAAGLIAEVSGGAVATGMIDVRTPAEPEPVIRLRTSSVNGLLGTALDRDEIASFLRKLRFDVQPMRTAEADLEVRVPSFRRDVTREVDLTEEVARLYGYDRIEPVPSVPRHDETAEARKRVEERRAQQDVRRRLRDTMAGFGFTEVVTHSLVHPDRNELIDPSRSSVLIDNPLSPELSAMRTSLAASMLSVLRWNANRKVRDIRIFEVGRVFWPKSDGLPDEPEHLCIAVTGQRHDPHWDGPPGAFDFFDLKGLAEALPGRLGLDRVETVPYDNDDPLFDADRTGELLADGVRIGRFGAVSHGILDRYDIREPVWMGVIDCGVLFGGASERRTYHSAPKYPAVERDLAIVVPDEVSHRDILEEIRACSGDLLEAVELFDVYRGEQIAANRKSMAYAMRFRSGERTLTDAEVTRLQDKVLRRLVNRYRAELRS